ncbi:MAG: nitroreductase family protein [Candidatus Hydrogenedentes bacterium]|nr:nitroreductase family protein [Candidatus Hydrogenedentota bacterium]
MDVFSAVEARRAVKHFDPEFKIDEDEIKRLLSYAMLSPTSFNIQHWRFVLIQDKELRRKIREVAWNQPQVTDSSLLIVLCADVKAWEKNPERYWKNAPEEVKKFVVPAIDSFYRGREQVQRDEAMRSCGIAGQTIMLIAKAMGYDSCPMIGFDFEAVGKLINLPEDHVIGMMIAIGKAVKPAWPRAGQLSYEEVVIINKFDK